MSKLNKILLLVFILQAGLAMLLSAREGNLAVNSKSESLLNLTLSDIQDLQIESAGKSIKIAMQDGSWILPEANNFPVEKSKIEEIIGDLLKVKVGFPAGTTTTSAKQFKTADSEYEKLLKINKKDGQSLSLFFGKSPAFRQVYVRKQGSNETYPVEYETYRLANDVNSWFSRSLLKVDRASIDVIKFSGFEINKQNDKFVLADMQANEEIKSEGIEDVLKRVAEISYSEMPVSTQPEDFEKLPEIFKLTLSVKGSLQDIIFKGPLPKKEETEAEQVYVKSSVSPYYFKISKTVVSDLKEIGRGMLVSEKIISETPDVTAK